MEIELKAQGCPATARRSGRPKLCEIVQREQHIIDVAGETFLKFGFDGTTMDAVAEAAGISKRTLYSRYLDKTALFDAVLRDLINRWLIPIDGFQSEQDALSDTLFALANYMTSFALTPKSISINRIIIAEAERQPQFGRLANEAGRKPAVRAVASILRRHHAELRPTDLDMAAEQFMSLAVDSHLRLAYLGLAISPKRIQTWVRASVDLFMTGISRRSYAAGRRIDSASVRRKGTSIGSSSR
jgi:AcrR family transcriptional regulator